MTISYTASLTASMDIASAIKTASQNLRKNFFGKLQYHLTCFEQYDENSEIFIANIQKTKLFIFYSLKKITKHFSINLKHF